MIEVGRIFDGIHPAPFDRDLPKRFRQTSANAATCETGTDVGEPVGSVINVERAGGLRPLLADGGPLPDLEDNVISRGSYP